MNYSILINTCDKFEDCWNPFFTLFQKYWPDCKGKIYLNTEKKEFAFDNLDITSLKVASSRPELNNSHAKWGQCLRWALENIESDVVLYLQEDYFLKDYVKNDIIEKYVDLITSNNEIDCIHLTDQGSPGLYSSPFENLQLVPKYHQDRISCQAALWRRDVLLQYIRDFESGWNFEWWGSKRAGILNHGIYSVDRNWVKLGNYEIIPYLFTGVVGGKWLLEVVPLFEKHQIIIDYEMRGFFYPRRMTTSERLLSKIKRVPVEIREVIDIIKLMLKLK
ncbi:hypothetical protein GVN22_25050 [Cellulophaga sp. BC115SP]|nr:hypothetical protein [Cellulophaga sp. BC115SP]